MPTIIRNASLWLFRAIGIIPGILRKSKSETQPCGECVARRFFVDVFLAIYKNCITKGIRNLKGNKSCRLACTQTLFYFSFRSFRRHRSINPLRFIFYHARSTDFEKKNEGVM